MPFFLIIFGSNNLLFRQQINLEHPQSSEPNLNLENIPNNLGGQNMSCIWCRGSGINSGLTHTHTLATDSWALTVEMTLFRHTHADNLMVHSEPASAFYCNIKMSRGVLFGIQEAVTLLVLCFGAAQPQHGLLCAEPSSFKNLQFTYFLWFLSTFLAANLDFFLPRSQIEAFKIIFFRIK